MFARFLYWRKKPPSERLWRAYQTAFLRLLTSLTKAVRNWEKQPLQHRKWQLLICLIGLLVLGSFSVYYTATGHFFTHLTQKHHEQQPNVGPFRRK